IRDEGSGAGCRSVVQPCAFPFFAGPGFGYPTQRTRIAEARIREFGGEPSFLGYRGFPASICTSVNDEVEHGIPGPRRLVEGEIISLDLGVVLDGFHGDLAVTVPVGKVSPAVAR